MTSLRLEPYAITLARATRDATGQHQSRHGAVLTVSGRGHRGRGDLAPLPGRSRETLDQCLKALAALDPRALPAEAAFAGHGWADALKRASELVAAELPAARHALETALFDWCGALQGRPAPALLAELVGAPPASDALPVAALIDALDTSEALRQSVRAAEQGIRALKLKIAGTEPDASILERVQRLAPRFSLRVDANRSLGKEQLSRLAPALSKAQVEFLEEPLAWADLPAPAPSWLPLAADESLADPEFSLGLAVERGIRVLVLKPMQLGFLRTLALVREARAADLEVVLSHTFDGPFSMAATRALGLCLGRRSFADGLSSHAALDGWQARLPSHVTAPSLATWPEAGWGIL